MELGKKNYVFLGVPQAGVKLCFSMIQPETGKRYMYLHK